jgi:hypothetical protein
MNTTAFNFYVTLQDNTGDEFTVVVKTTDSEAARVEAQSDFPNTSWTGTVWDSTPVEA